MTTDLIGVKSLVIVPLRLCGRTNLLVKLLFLFVSVFFLLTLTIFAEDAEPLPREIEHANSNNSSQSRGNGFVYVTEISVSRDVQARKQVYSIPGSPQKKPRHGFTFSDMAKNIDKGATKKPSEVVSNKSTTNSTSKSSTSFSSLARQIRFNKSQPTQTKATETSQPVSPKLPTENFSY